MLDEVIIYPFYASKKVLIGSRLKMTVRDRLIQFLLSKCHCFVWSHEDITGIDPSIIMYQFNVD